MAIADRAPATDAACGTSTRGLWAGPVTYRPGARPRQRPAVPGARAIGPARCGRGLGAAQPCGGPGPPRAPRGGRRAGARHGPRSNRPRAGVKARSRPARRAGAVRARASRGAALRRTRTPARGAGGPTRGSAARPAVEPPARRSQSAAQPSAARRPRRRPAIELPARRP